MLVVSDGSSVRPSSPQATGQHWSAQSERLAALPPRTPRNPLLMANRDCRAAIKALGGMGDRLMPGQVEALIACLDDGDNEVRDAARGALGGVGDRLTPGQMEAIVTDPRNWGGRRTRSPRVRKC